MQFIIWNYKINTFIIMNFYPQQALKIEFMSSEDDVGDGGF